MKITTLFLSAFILALTVWHTGTYAQTQAGSTPVRSADAYQKSLVRYEAETCIRDLRQLEAVLKDAHPCLYCFVDSLTLHRAFAVAITDLEKKQGAADTGKVTENEFLGTVRRLIALVQDGHLYAESNESLVNYVAERGRFFPLSLAIESGAAFISADYSASLDSSASGSELLAVNGVKTADILAKMLPMLTADADLEKAKWRQLENVFTFDILYWSLYEPTDTFQITYRTADGLERSEHIKGVTGSTINLANADAGASRRLVIDKANATAYLDINTFYSAESKRENATYEKFLADAFRQLKKERIENLVIDLRDNPGGLVHNAYKLFSYVSPVNVESRVMVKSSKFLKEQKKSSFIEFLLKKISRQSYAARLSKAPFGSLVEVSSKQHFLRKNSDKFTGKTYVLANGATFSAASMFVKLCKDYGAGVITGEENAACQSVSFGDLVDFRMPSTAVKVYLSTSIVNREDDLEKRSVQPDISLVRNVREDAKGKDSVLAQLLTIVNKSTPANSVARHGK